MKDCPSHGATPSTVRIAYGANHLRLVTTERTYDKDNFFRLTQNKPRRDRARATAGSRLLYWIISIKAVRNILTGI